MPTKSFFLQGKTTLQSEQICEDGEMSTLDMRNQGASLIPDYDTKNIYTPINKGQIFIHKGANFENWIVYNETGVYFEAQKKGEVFTTKNIQITNTSPFSVNAINNILSISAPKTIYAIFSNEKYAIEEVVIPRCDITKAAINTINSTNDVEVAPKVDNMIETEGEKKLEKSSDIDIVTAIFQKKADEIRQNNDFGASLVRWALKDVFGRYIYISPPIFIQHAEIKLLADIFYHQDRNMSDPIRFFAFAKMSAQIITSKSNFRILSYKNSKTIQSIDIFSSSLIKKDTISNIDSFRINSISHVVDTPYVYQYVSHVESYNSRAQDNQYDEIEKLVNFFLVKSIPYREPEGGVNLIEETIDFSAVRNLETNRQLTEDFYPHTLSAKNTFVYNNKLHACSPTEDLFKGYELRDFLPYQTSGDYFTQFTILTRIKTEAGEASVKRACGHSLSNQTKTYFISYPDARAYEMVLSSGWDNGFQKTIKLKPHPLLDMAYYFDPIGINILGTDTGIDMAEKNTIATRPNILKVSDTDNPMVFPVENTYQFSDKIIGLAAPTQAISQGQFGQFPLYVFTKDGIWAMQVGTNTAYATQHPISRDVATSNIISLDNAVAYATARDIRILSGGSIQVISQELPDIQVQELAYDYQNNDIIVKKDEKYLAYNTQYKHWRDYNKIPNQIIASYPDLYFLQNEKIEIITPEKKTAGTFTTRAIKLEHGFKKVDIIILRGVFNQAQATIFASNDTINWKQVQSAKNTTYAEKIQMRLLTSSIKYIKIQFTGDTTTRIDNIEIQYRNSLNNKLR